MGGKTGTILMQVRVPSVARDFSPSSADSLVASVQPLCAITSINVCASRSVCVSKIPNTASYTTVWTHKNTCTLIGMGSTTLGNPNFLQGTMKCFFFLCSHLHLLRNDCNTLYVPHWRKSPSTQLEQFSEGDRFSAYSIAHVQVNIMHKILKKIFTIKSSYKIQAPGLD